MAEIDDEELAALRKNAALYEGLLPKYTDAETKLKDLVPLQERVKALEGEKLESVWTGAGITDPKVRRIFQLEFDEQAAGDAGEKDLGAFLTGLKALEADKRPAHLAPFLTSPGATGGAGGGQGGQGGNAGQGAGQRTNVLPNSGKGAKEVEGAPPDLTPEKVLGTSSEEFRGMWGRLQKEVPGVANLPLPGGPAASQNN